MTEEDSEGDLPNLAEEYTSDSDLSNFRHRWKEELKEKRTTSPLANRTKSKEPTTAQSHYEEAKDLFNKGTWAEQNGMAFEAMEYYRRATKMVPDIDIQMTAAFRKAQSSGHTSTLESSGDPTEDRCIDDDCADIHDLCVHFSKLCENRKICEPAKETTTRHISDLPLELLMVIIRWVISSTLDVRSLEQLSMASRGFYLLSRDHKIWKDICQRIWGDNLLLESSYLSWRQMCIERPHLLFNGVYMSKIEFMRQGEPTLDKFYPPWQKVVYYRYLRFFPDGLVFMHTSPRDPVAVVAQLKNTHAKIDGLCKGMYRMEDGKISCIMKRVKRPEVQPFRQYKRNRRNVQPESETTFLADFTLSSHGKRSNILLHWKQYLISVFNLSSGTESSSEFHLTQSEFPDLNFARVKNYMSESHLPL